MFAPESGICKAALHSKVLGSDGGDVVVTVGFGQDAYFGSSGGSIVSKDAGICVRARFVIREHRSVCVFVSVRAVVFAILLSLLLIYARFLGPGLGDHGAWSSMRR